MDHLCWWAPERSWLTSARKTNVQSKCDVWFVVATWHIIIWEPKSAGRSKFDFQLIIACLELVQASTDARLQKSCATFVNLMATAMLKWVNLYLVLYGFKFVILADLRAKCKACRFEKCKQIGLTEAGKYSCSYTIIFLFIALNSRRTNTSRRAVSDSPPSCPVIRLIFKCNNPIVLDHEPTNLQRKAHKFET